MGTRLILKNGDVVVVVIVIGRWARENRTPQPDPIVGGVAVCGKRFDVGDQRSAIDLDHNWNVFDRFSVFNFEGRSTLMNAGR